MVFDVKGKTLCDLLLKNERENAETCYLRQPTANVWQEYTWREVMHRARQVARFLQQCGLQKGARVSIFSKNCVEWFMVDFGITLAGMVNVPLFANQHEKSIHYVLQHAGVELVFIGKLDHHQRTRASLPEQMPTANMGYHPKLQTDHQWSDILGSEPLQEIVHPKPSDLYTIIYSSGTSALPKGVMFSHERITRYLAIVPTDVRRLTNLDYYRLISYLPLAHVYERATIQLVSVACPSEVSFVESLDTFARNLKEIKPSLFSAVPRIWDVFKNKIRQQLPEKRLNLLLKIPVISWIVKNKIKRQLGLIDCRVSISGAAHLPVSLLEFFDKINLKVQEGYGQTENLSYGTLSLINQRRFGYVGSPRYGVEIKLGDNQELLMKSPCLMSGYYRDPEATAAAFTDDGWLKTGDVVEIDSLNRVKILGRLSENFKNQKGEFIAPTPIEKLFFDPVWMEQICLLGSGLASNVMLVSLTAEAANTPSAQTKVFLQDRLRSTNSKLKTHEKIGQIIIVREHWTTDNDLLTPTLKVKRREIAKKYHDFIEGAAKQSQKVMWE